jgi:hypothetical protein
MQKSGLQNSLHKEWQFVQIVTNGIGPEFASMEQTLVKTLLPTLLGDECNNDDPHYALSGLTIR